MTSSPPSTLTLGSSRNGEFIPLTCVPQAEIESWSIAHRMLFLFSSLATQPTAWKQIGQSDRRVYLNISPLNSLEPHQQSLVIHNLEIAHALSTPGVIPFSIFLKHGTCSPTDVQRLSSEKFPLDIISRAAFSGGSELKLRFTRQASISSAIQGNTAILQARVQLAKSSWKTVQKVSRIALTVINGHVEQEVSLFARIRPTEKSPKNLVRLKKEINNGALLARLEIPYIARTYRTTASMIDQELCDLGPADHWVKTLPKEAILQQALLVFHLLTQAIRKLHNNGLCHMDIKPHNVLIKKTETGVEPRLADLESITPVGKPRHISTSSYEAPEQKCSQKPCLATYPADIWSLGITFYELIYGGTMKNTLSLLFRSPSQGGKMTAEQIKLAAQAIRKQLEKEKSGSAITIGLSALICSMLEENPVDRPTAERVALELERLILLQNNTTPLE